MKVELVSYRSEASSSLKLALTKKLFNQSRSDMILFAGHTIDSIKDLNNLSQNLQNNYGTTAFLELKEIFKSVMTNWAFKIENNQLVNSNSNQQFASSAQINNNEYLAANLLEALRKSRLHVVKKKKICFLICGEINIVTNIQNRNNKVVIRTKEWEKDFENIFDETSIILNPLHTPMGNQGKMAKRREYFSKNGKAYFSTANLEYKRVYAKEYFSKSKSLQYAYFNGKSISAISENITSDFVSRVYEILFPF